MARRAARPAPAAERALLPVAATCPARGQPLHNAYLNRRTITSLGGVTRFHLQVRRCHQADCGRRRLPCRPEAEGRLALPHHEFGLDVLAHVRGGVRVVAATVTRLHPARAADRVRGELHEWQERRAELERRREQRRSRRDPKGYLKELEEMPRQLSWPP
jgi:hypothetical protein